MPLDALSAIRTRRAPVTAGPLTALGMAFNLFHLRDHSGNTVWLTANELADGARLTALCGDGGAWLRASFPPVARCRMPLGFDPLAAADHVGRLCAEAEVRLICRHALPREAR